VATVFLDPTKAVASYPSRIVSIDDIEWRPNLDADKQRGVAAARSPRRRRHQGDGSDWRVEVWRSKVTSLYGMSRASKHNQRPAPNSRARSAGPSVAMIIRAPPDRPVEPS
jgi:hypothetical protein